MSIRTIRVEDYNAIKALHEKFFAEDFNFPDFVKHFLGAFVVEDEGKIIVAGGIRTITEAILITDKDCDIRNRRQALYQALYASMYINKRSGYDQLHAFVTDEKWQKHLILKGFKETIGHSLVMEY